MTLAYIRSYNYELQVNVNECISHIVGWTRVTIFYFVWFESVDSTRIHITQRIAKRQLYVKKLRNAHAIKTNNESKISTTHHVVGKRLISNFDLHKQKCHSKDCTHRN